MIIFIMNFSLMKKEKYVIKYEEQDKYGLLEIEDKKIKKS